MTGMMQQTGEPRGALTLPSYLAPEPRLVFVSMNPGIDSDQVGCYFASPRNRFWRALNLVRLVQWEVGPENDHLLPEKGISFTDVLKRPTSIAGDLNSEDFRASVPLLKKKLSCFQPKVVSFHEVTTYGNYFRYGDGVLERPGMGMQPLSMGRSQVFAVPNHGTLNASVSLEELASWYIQLQSLVEIGIGNG